MGEGADAQWAEHAVGGACKAVKSFSASPPSCSLNCTELSSTFPPLPLAPLLWALVLRAEHHVTVVKEEFHQVRKYLQGDPRCPHIWANLAAPDIPFHWRAETQQRLFTGVSGCLSTTSPRCALCALLPASCGGERGIGLSLLLLR